MASKVPWAGEMASMWRALACDSTADHPDAPEDPALMPISADTITKDICQHGQRLPQPIGTAEPPACSRQWTQTPTKPACAASNVAVQGHIWRPSPHPVTSASFMQKSLAEGNSA